MSTITTFTDKSFDPCSPDPTFLDEGDIAHALSMMCRANGHFREFYSVAQHSINCMLEARARGLSKKLQKACLLHDASEAYMSDVTRPLKKHLAQYLDIEAHLQHLIYQVFLGEALTIDEQLVVSQIDDAMLYHEFLFFMEARVLEEEPKLLSVPQFAFMPFKSIEQQYLQLLWDKSSCDAGLSVGVDWCKGKWLATTLADGKLGYCKFDSIESLCQTYSEAKAILIDIPIGLPMSKLELANRPDTQLRQLVHGSRKSCVFAVPCRQAVYAENEQKKAVNLQILGKSLSAQSIGFCGSIAQVDRFLQQHTSWKNRLYESHPEYCFQLLNADQPLHHKKTEQLGQVERIDILSRYVSSIRLLVDEYFKDVVYRKKLDDLLDAACLAVMGNLGLKYGFKRLPEQPYADSTGLFMQIVTANMDKL